jgi:lipocalin
MLSRNPHLDEATYQRVIGNAQQLGFPVSDFLKSTRVSAS